MAGRIRTSILVCVAFLAVATAADARHSHKHRFGPDRAAKASILEIGVGRSARGGRQQPQHRQDRVPAVNADDVLQQSSGPAL